MLGLLAPLTLVPVSIGLGPGAVGRAETVPKSPGAHVRKCELHPGPALATDTAWGQGG